jgi:hypothetical protein
MFFLFVAVTGNFLAVSLRCGTQRFLDDNAFSKHVILILTIYFGAVAASNTSLEPTSPLNLVLNSIAVWLIFVIFTKAGVQVMLAAVACLTVASFAGTHAVLEGPDSTWAKTRDNMMIFAALISCAGFVYDITQKYKKHTTTPQGFNPFRYLFSKYQCADKVEEKLKKDVALIQKTVRAMQAEN